MTADPVPVAQSERVACASSNSGIRVACRFLES